LLLGSALTVDAQSLTWGQHSAAVPFGSGSPATSQTQVVTVTGSGLGSGTMSIQLSVAGGSNAWNGFGVAGNDDGYYSGPNQPIPGITFTNGGPGFNGGIPLVAPVSLVSGYNLASAPPSTPAPNDDRQVLYFDGADGTTVSIAWNFTTLVGGVLPAGSWLFLDSVDQGEFVNATAAAGWIGTIHAGDSTLPRPSSPIPVPVMVSAPTFPICTPVITTNSTTLQLLGRYGDISVPTPTCSAVPVPVQGQTVGYTKGTDSVGIWVQTARPLENLVVTVRDTDPDVGNGMGGFNGPDNNFVMGAGIIVQTLAGGAGPVQLPSIGNIGAVLLMLLALVLGLRRLGHGVS